MCSGSRKVASFIDKLSKLRQGSWKKTAKVIVYLLKRISADTITEALECLNTKLKDSVYIWIRYRFNLILFIQYINTGNKFSSSKNTEEYWAFKEYSLSTYL